MQIKCIRRRQTVHVPALESFVGSGNYVINDDIVEKCNGEK